MLLCISHGVTLFSPETIRLSMVQYSVELYDSLVNDGVEKSVKEAGRGMNGVLSCNFSGVVEENDEEPQTG